VDIVVALRKERWCEIVVWLREPLEDVAVVIVIVFVCD